MTNRELDAGEEVLLDGYFPQEDAWMPFLVRKSRDEAEKK